MAASGRSWWRIADTGEAVGRFVWYVALSLLAGSLYLIVRRLGDGPAGEALNAASRRVLPIAVALGLAAAALRWMIAVGSGYATYQRAVPDRVLAALTTRQSLLWLAILLGLGGLRIMVLRVAMRHPIPARDVLVPAVALSLLAGLSVGTGHLSAPIVNLLAGSVHLLAMALWMGPLAVLGLITLDRGWRAADPQERRAVLRRLFAGYAVLAGWTFAVLVTSGLVLARHLVTATSSIAPRYLVILGIKGVLIAAVLVPLAYYHDRAARRDITVVHDARDVFGSPRLLFGVRAEAAIAAVVLVLAAGLGMTSPFAPSAPRSIEVAGLAGAQAVSDPQECADLEIGGPACYRRYFSDLLRSAGASTAISRVEELAQSDPYLADHCHTVVHEIGREAASFYPSLAAALVEARPACWSGYEHGVIEAALSPYEDSELVEALPSICAEPERYSFAHYSCVHGLGHGVMMRVDGDLFRAIDICTTLPDGWEAESCLSGVFMENVVRDQQQPGSGAFDPGDLLYPCTVVAEGHRQTCYLMQTSYALWRLGGDYAATFAVCDGADEPYQPTCYQSLGRDISGRALLDVETVIHGCSLGRPSLQAWCIAGAAMNAVLNDHDTTMADKLCSAVPPEVREPCWQARHEAAANL